jgi:AcrR family transcriptional regulator
MELYWERGFESTTVAEIADRAGVTERTFFRHFADKREVLFGGSESHQELLVAHLVGVPDDAAPIDAVTAALEAVSAVIQEHGEWAQRRHAVISANAELRERELVKMASFVSAMAEALRRRGVKEPAARLTAEAGVAAYKVAYERWVQQPNKRNLPRLVRESLQQLKAVTAGNQ